MTTVTKGPYYWDIRGGGGSARAKFVEENKDQIPQGSTYLEVDGDHNLYIWNADVKAFSLF